jgi:hypothetical protein
MWYHHPLGENDIYKSYFFAMQEMVKLNPEYFGLVSLDTAFTDYHKDHTNESFREAFKQEAAKQSPPKNYLDTTCEIKKLFDRSGSKYYQLDGERG